MVEISDAMMQAAAQALVSVRCGHLLGDCCAVCRARAAIEAVAAGLAEQARADERRRTLQAVVSVFAARAGRFRQIATSGRGPDGEALNVGQRWSAISQAWDMDEAARIVTAMLGKGGDRG